MPPFSKATNECPCMTAAAMAKAKLPVYTAKSFSGTFTSENFFMKTVYNAEQTAQVSAQMFPAMEFSGPLFFVMTTMTQPVKASMTAIMLFGEKRSLRKTADRITTNMELLLVRINTLDKAVFFNAIKYTYAPRANMKPIINNAAKRFGVSVKIFCPFFFALTIRNIRKTRAHTRKRRLTNTVAGTVESLKNIELQDVKKTTARTAAFGSMPLVFFAFIALLPVFDVIIMITPAPAAESTEGRDHEYESCLREAECNA